MLEPRPTASATTSPRTRSSPPETLLLDRANLLELTAPEMTVLVGGLRALGANTGGSRHGVFTDRPGTLTNDFFVNLLDARTEWKTSAAEENVYEGRDRATGEVGGPPPRSTSCSASHSQLRAHRRGLRQRPTARSGSSATSCRLDKVMDLDRFDLA